MLCRMLVLYAQRYEHTAGTEPQHSQTELLAGTDLIGIFLKELLQCHCSGAVLNDFSSANGEFYYTTPRGEKRHTVITACDPSVEVPVVNVMNIVTGPGY